MTNREQSVLDEIDALVDEQLQQTRSGYDHNVNQQRCRICGGDTHTLPITERMREMRRLHWSTVGYYEGEARVSQRVVDELNAYRYDQDESRIVCPGSDFIGPMPAPVVPQPYSIEALRAMRERVWALPDDPFDASDVAGSAGGRGASSFRMSNHGCSLRVPSQSLRVRLWDADWNCVYDSDNDTRNHWDVIGERGDERTNYSIDRADGREHGHVATGSGGLRFVRDDVPPEPQYPPLQSPFAPPFLFPGASVTEGFTPVGTIARREFAFGMHVDPDVGDRFRRMSEAMQRVTEAISDIGLQFTYTRWLPPTYTDDLGRPVPDPSAGRDHERLRMRRRRKPRWPALFPAMKRRGKGRQRGRRFIEWDADRQPVAWGSIQGGRRA